MIGLYVGLATVGVFIYWFTTDEFDGHTLVSLDQLMNWGQCSAWGGFSAAPMMGMDFSADACHLLIKGVLDSAGFCSWFVPLCLSSILHLFEMSNSERPR